MASTGHDIQTLDLNITQGATLRPFPLEFTNPDGSDVNFDGVFFKADIKRRVTDANPVASFTIVYQSPKTIWLSLDESAFKGVPLGKTAKDAKSQFVWDLDLVWPDGAIDTPVRGTIFVTPDVTQEA